LKKNGSKSGSEIHDPPEPKTPDANAVPFQPPTPATKHLDYDSTSPNQYGSIHWNNGKGGWASFKVPPDGYHSSSLKLGKDDEQAAAWWMVFLGELDYEMGKANDDWAEFPKAFQFAGKSANDAYPGVSPALKPRGVQALSAEDLIDHPEKPANVMEAIALSGVPLAILAMRLMEYKTGQPVGQPVPYQTSSDAESGSSGIDISPILFDDPESMYKPSEKGKGPITFKQEHVSYPLPHQQPEDPVAGGPGIAPFASNPRQHTF
jgi:hypothetical protein